MNVNEPHDSPNKHNKIKMKQNIERNQNGYRQCNWNKRKLYIYIERERREHRMTENEYIRKTKAHPKQNESRERIRAWWMARVDVMWWCGQKPTTIITHNDRTNIKVKIYLRKFQLSRCDAAQSNCDLPYHVVFSHVQNAPFDWGFCGRMHWPGTLPPTLRHVHKPSHDYYPAMIPWTFSPVRRVSSSILVGNGWWMENREKTMNTQKGGIAVLECWCKQEATVCDSSKISVAVSGCLVAFVYECADGGSNSSSSDA